MNAWTRTWATFLMICSLAMGIGITNWVSAQDATTRQPTFHDRLIAGLKVRTDEEKAFIDEVMAKTLTEEIPLSLVESSFAWVNKNKPDHKYPFVYFEKILRLRGDQEGVAIPAYTYKPFNQFR